MYLRFPIKSITLPANRKRTSAFLSLLLFGAFASTLNAAPTINPKQPVDFAKQVQPIFTKHCIKCHGPKKQKGKFRLDQRTSLINGGDSGEPAINLGKSGTSHLIKLVTEAVEDEVMPPKGKSLSDQEIETLKAWIDQGANWPGQMSKTKQDVDGLDHWSFQPVKRPALPKVKLPAGGNAIDAFILQRLNRAGLQPSPQANRRTLIRRAYLILHGLPPTPQDVEQFIADKTPNAYERLITRLLASPRYGERWARHWLDIARFAETNGFETNTPRVNAWRYRDYVIDAFNKDKPYDQFIKEQLAGDQLGADVATGFIVGGAYDVVKSPDINLTLMQRNDELHDMVNTTTTAFLGLTVACARCHNHKFDPISQKDYYAFQAVFAGVNHGDRAIAGGATKEKQEKVAALRQENAKHQAALDAFAPSPVQGPLPHTVVMDDEAVGRTPGIELLHTKRGHGTNPGGSSRGFKDDPGDIDRMPNISGGRYTYWEGDIKNKDLAAYRPGVEGRYRVWLSWGCGWNTHQTAVTYHVDLDGNLDTRDDQKQIAVIDQQAFADGTKVLNSKAMWSGLRDTGSFEFAKTSRILVRAGDSTKPVSTDVIVLQADSRVPDATGTASSTFAHPRLRSTVNAKLNEERFPPIEAKYVRFTAFATNSSEPCLDEIEVFTADTTAQNIALASAGSVATASGSYQGNPKHKLEHINDGQYGNSRSWISNTSGTGWVQIEFKEQAKINRINWGRDRQVQFADRLATAYRIEVAIEVNGQPGPWQTVASSEGRLPGGMMVDAAPVYRFAGLTREQAKEASKHHDALKANNQQIAVLTQPIRAYAGNFVQPGPTHRLFRGDPMQPREVVAPGAVTALNGDLALKPNEPQVKRRVEMANWIASKRNPLTARVMVNRIWLHHFGEGLVNTPSDFGHMGAKPTHPQLLDWLANEFMDSGWSVKHIQKLILSSHTWKQSSLPIAAAQKVDADSLLLWRFPPRRIEAEVIRDATLAVAGSLDLRMGGPGFDVFKPNGNYVRFYEPKTTFGTAEWRRMIYMYKVRMEQDATFGVFDCPDAGQVIASRSRSTTALQALNLLNSPFVLQQAKLMAERLTKKSKKPAEQVHQAFLLAFGRSPSNVEVQQSEALIGEHGLDAFCRAILNANEFLFVQ